MNTYIYICVYTCVCVYAGCANAVCQRINKGRQSAFALRIRHVRRALRVCASLCWCLCVCAVCILLVCLYRRFANYLAVSSALSVSINNWLTKVLADECRDSRAENLLQSVNQDTNTHTHTWITIYIYIYLGRSLWRMQILSSWHSCSRAGNCLKLLVILNAKQV